MLSPILPLQANLSDIFEYTSIDLCHSIFNSLSELMVKGGRIAYWELLTPRAPPLDMFISHEKLSKELHDQDRVFFYKSFNVYEIKWLLVTYYN